MNKLREVLGEEIRRPVGDGMWEYLQELGFVQDAEGMPLREAVEYLRMQLRKIQAAGESMHGTPVTVEVRDETLNARVDALSVIAAAWAAGDGDVVAFRRSALMRRTDPAAIKAWAFGGPHPGFDLLTEDDVPMWLLDQYNATPETDDGLDTVHQLAENQRIHLEFVDGGRPAKLTVPRLGNLGTLAKVSEKLAHTFRWHPAWATLFVLTGAEPIVSTYSASAQIRYGMDSAAGTRVTLTLDPFLPPEHVAELYKDLRAQLQPRPARRTQSLKAYRLAQHVGPCVQRYPANPAQVQRRGRPRKTPGGIVWYTDPVGGHTWTTLLRSWNGRYADQGEDGKNWTYDQLSNFTRDAQDALKRLLDPQWGLRMLSHRQSNAD